MTKTNKKSKTEWYRQCTYTSPTETGVMIETAWIPERLAQKDRKIYFGKKTSTPERIWTVTSVGGRKSGDYIAEHERDHLKQRQASDI